MQHNKFKKVNNGNCTDIKLLNNISKVKNNNGVLIAKSQVNNIAILNNNLSNLDAHQQMNGQGNCGTYTPWNITQPLKRIHLNQF